MKKFARVFLILTLAMIVIGVFAYQMIQSDLQKLADTKINDVDLSSIEDGVYQGESNHFPVMVSVEVTIENHRMKAILLLKHSNGQGQAAESILDDVLAQQTLNVDVISGATYSSQAILQAISVALAKE